MSVFLFMLVFKVINFIIKGAQAMLIVIHTKHSYTKFLSSIWYVQRIVVFNSTTKVNSFVIIQGAMWVVI